MELGGRVVIKVRSMKRKHGGRRRSGKGPGNDPEVEAMGHEDDRRPIGSENPPGYLRLRRGKRQPTDTVLRMGLRPPLAAANLLNRSWERSRRRKRRISQKGN